MSSVIPNINTIPPSPESLAIMYSYPLAKVRSGMGSQEYTNYKQDWMFFNTVWSYNYTVSSLNGILESEGKGSQYSSYKFASNADQISYRNGQISHQSVYPNSANVFNNIF